LGKKEKGKGKGKKKRGVKKNEDLSFFCSTDKCCFKTGNNVHDVCMDWNHQNAFIIRKQMFLSYYCKG
jgi:hypothetical protein